MTIYSKIIFQNNSWKNETFLLNDCVKTDNVMIILAIHVYNRITGTSVFVHEQIGNGYVYIWDYYICCLYMRRHRTKWG